MWNEIKYTYEIQMTFLPIQAIISFLIKEPGYL